MNTNTKMIRQSVRRWLMTLGAVAAVGWGMGACQEEDLNRTFEGPYFVRFTDSTLTYKESYSPPVAIRVHNVGPILNQPITVNYAVSGSAREGKDFTVQGTKGTVIIPANKSFGEISVKLINNANNILESQSLTFTLTGVQPSSLQVGFGNGGIVGKVLTLTIQDDCLLGGTYTGSNQIGKQTYSVQNVDITSTNCREYRISNWNIALPFFSFNAVRPTLTFIDNGDNSLTIPPQINGELNTTDTLRGTGAWNPRDRRITLNLDVKLRLSTSPVRDTLLRYTQTYTPQ